MSYKYVDRLTDYFFQESLLGKKLFLLFKNNNMELIVSLNFARV